MSEVVRNDIVFDIAAMIADEATKKGLNGMEMLYLANWIQALGFRQLVFA